MNTLSSLMRQNFLEYASYVVVDRAIPDIRDGAKPVQRRILHTISTMDDGKFTKVANIIGECMKLHPHGDVSIGDALVVLANKGRALGVPRRPRPQLGLREPARRSSTTSPRTPG